jgi:meiotically up-regulated gene 157 (Mug157) protein
VRTPLNQRKFNSPAVEAAIIEFKKNISNKEIAWLFENCFPNTLDTTVDFETKNGKPDTYVITGDIDAMWLRDSTAQVWPYLQFLKQDKKLQELIAGVIHRQTFCILKDPYANAFYKDENKISEWKESDITKMLPGIHERKWEIDSLCYPIRLAHQYWKLSGDATPFNEDWKESIRLTLKTFKEQQRKESKGTLHLPEKNIVGHRWCSISRLWLPGKTCWINMLVFRPSDDATIFPFLIPSNLFAVGIIKPGRRDG